MPSFGVLLLFLRLRTILHFEEFYAPVCEPPTLLSFTDKLNKEVFYTGILPRERSLPILVIVTFNLKACLPRCRCKISAPLLLSCPIKMRVFHQNESCLIASILPRVMKEVESTVAFFHHQSILLRRCFFSLLSYSATRLREYILCSQVSKRFVEVWKVAGKTLRWNVLFFFDTHGVLFTVRISGASLHKHVGHSALLRYLWSWAS